MLPTPDPCESLSVDPNQTAAKLKRKASRAIKRTLNPKVFTNRPIINRHQVDLLCDLSDLFDMKDVSPDNVHPDKLYKTIDDEKKDLNFGEGARELLRSAVALYGASGGIGVGPMKKKSDPQRVAAATDGSMTGSYKGATLPDLLVLAHEKGLWNLVQRLKIERKAKRKDLHPIHRSYVEYMSAMKKRQRYDEAITGRNGSKISTPDAFLDYYERHNAVPPIDKFRPGVGRDGMRDTMRKAHSDNKRAFLELCAREGLNYTRLRDWTLQQLNYMLEKIGPDYIPLFIASWRNRVNRPTSHIKGNSSEEENQQNIDESCPMLSPIVPDVIHSPEPCTDEISTPETHACWEDIPTIDHTINYHQMPPKYSHEPNEWWAKPTIDHTINYHQMPPKYSHEPNEWWAKPPTTI